MNQAGAAAKIRGDLATPAKPRPRGRLKKLPGMTYRPTADVRETLEREAARRGISKSAYLDRAVETQAAIDATAAKIAARIFPTSGRGGG